MGKETVAKDKEPVSGKKWSYVGLSVFLLALGVCALIWPNIGLAAICVAVGAASVLFGIISIIAYFLREIRGVALSYDFSVGVLAVIAGIILLIRPQGVVELLQVIIGIYLLLDSVFKLQTAIDSKRLGMSGWWVPLVFTVACLVLGILMILKIGADILMMLIGIALVADGLQNLCLVIYAAIAARQLKRMDKDGNGVPDIFEAADEQTAPQTDAVPQPEQAEQPRLDEPAGVEYTNIEGSNENDQEK